MEHWLLKHLFLTLNFFVVKLLQVAFTQFFLVINPKDFPLQVNAERTECTLKISFLKSAGFGPPSKRCWVYWLISFYKVKEKLTAVFIFPAKVWKLLSKTGMVSQDKNFHFLLRNNIFSHFLLYTSSTCFPFLCFL